MTEETPVEPNDPGHLPPGAYERCVDVLEMITDYLEGALPPDRTTLIDEHLSACDGCRTVLDQWRTVVELAGRVTADALDSLQPSARDRLLASFRDQRTTELS
jgi:anti-sigma factor RsiW